MPVCLWRKCGLWNNLHASLFQLLPHSPNSLSKESSALCQKNDTCFGSSSLFSISAAWEALSFLFPPLLLRQQYSLNVLCTSKQQEGHNSPERSLVLEQSVANGNVSNYCHFYFLPLLGCMHWGDPAQLLCSASANTEDNIPGEKI